MFDPIFEWLVDGAPGATDSKGVIERMCPELVRAGVPLDRFGAFVKTLHPHLMGRGFRWNRGEPVQITGQLHEALRDPSYLGSTIAWVHQNAEPLRRRLVDPSSPRDYLPLDELAADGFTDYLAAPMLFMNGEVHAVSFATRAADGFTEPHIKGFLRIVRPLSRIAEILAQRRTAANLLDAYVGHKTGERIVAGQIRRGDAETIRAVLWFSDLRGFTALSASLPTSAVLAVLNGLFDCQVPAIERHGGEVLKFMGDGLLAIFPIGDAGASPATVCEAAFTAAEEAMSALRTFNATRAGEPPIRFGLALHVGEVAYGNIGGAARLDFTCIGPAVNVASRLEGLTGKVDRPVVVSADIARLTARATTPLGAFELKGVPAPEAVFAPADGILSAW
jgi:adenylate cyclase